MTERVTPRRIVPMSDSIEDGAAHAAATDLELVEGTQALVRRAAGNRAVLCYHSPNWDTQRYSTTHAPYADLTDATTWTSFTIGDEDKADQAPFQIPWYVSDAHDYPALRFSFVCDARYLSFESRVQKSTFVQATSTEDFYAPASYMPFFSEQMSEWVTATWDKGWPSAFFPTIECNGISLPSSPRDVLLTPQVKISQRGTSALAGVAGSVRVYISQCMIYDDWDE